MAKKSKASKKSKKDESASSSKAWSALALVSGMAGATVAKKGLNASWKAATGKQPPANPADPDVAFMEAVAWAAVSGTFVALAKMLATRRAAGYYVKSTGHLPPQLAADKPAGNPDPADAEQSPEKATAGRS